MTYLDQIKQLSDLILQNHASDPDETADLLTIIQDAISCQRDYLSARVDMNLFLTLPKCPFEGNQKSVPEQREYLDQFRRSKHIRMVNSINTVNRLAISEGMNPIFMIPGLPYKELKSEIDGDREIAAAIALEVLKELYLLDEIQYIKPEVSKESIFRK